MARFKDEGDRIGSQADHGQGRSGDKRAKKAAKSRTRSRSMTAEPAMGTGDGKGENARIEYVSISQETRRRYLNYALR
ncbi:MAG: hypothetical protein Ct9H300mP1_22210 [Planctomycetaceae bacterium]|nr:MAG: hypothetical protein Ct9H300mP1_22210 [Planctomycetaceae bacterium]